MAKDQQTMATKPEDNIHIMVKSPKFIRKQVLALTIETIELLKKVKQYKQQKEEKHRLMKELKKTLDEIKKLNKELESKELPLKLQDIDNLPVFKKQKEALKVIERLRQKTEKEWEEEEKELKRELAKTPKLPPEAPEPEVKKEEIEKIIKPKPKDQLEADLEALREKMAQL
ncbi:hypothetical protein D6777_03390 [Candidatus Woesearchaeota archaeon]|nr:MAG: hypothetical protein D6777_03390 [Candidatus Woesearchaeota archaeon]